MNHRQRTGRPIEMWGGVECTVNRVGDQWFDQLQWSGHDVRLSDLDRFAKAGFRTLRYPLLWERLAPTDPDRIDWAWADERMSRLRALGIRPIVGLVHHGSGPAYTCLLDDDFPQKLARFAGNVAARYPWVLDYTPVNEPLTTARFSCLYGHWYPHMRDERAFIRALLNQLRATVGAMEAIRRVVPQARLVQTEDCGGTFGASGTAAQAEHDDARRWLTWDLLCGRVDSSHALYPYLCDVGFSPADRSFFSESAVPPDLLGLNYYVTSDRLLDTDLWKYPTQYHGGNGRVQYADVEAVRARPEGIVGHAVHLADAWKRYQRPLAITEVHLACTREEQLRWLHEAWWGAVHAANEGADVRAVTAWALVGSSNWDSLVTCDRGHYEPGVFDIRAPEPRPTALASLVTSLGSEKEPQSSIVCLPGWWRRPDRFTFTSVLGQGSTCSAAPILVVGASGTLSSAFRRVCARRGIPLHCVGRPDLDITDPATIERMLNGLHPWAVVNASGYVRVDDAEHDAVTCHRVNVEGCVNIAAACRRFGMPLVTFSSDLVFDGRKLTAYVEDDEPHPLNAYGASKANAERAVLDLLPEALVIRTSAFFGPWDQHHFLAHVFRALDEDRPFHAADDIVVSPTYVPDLVDATLDLLIDGEHGVWHLANEGAVTWFDFARTAAERSGRRCDGVVAGSSCTISAPARRPAMSALASRRGRLLRTLEHALEAFLAEREQPADVAPCVPH